MIPIETKSVAIIPGRGGSKRIPQKSIKDFLGKPVIAYAIEAALGSGIFSEVIVTTDDENIAFIAQEYGADVPFIRGYATSHDTATTNDVLREVFEKIPLLSQKYVYACCLYPAAVFASSDMLKKAFSLIKASKTDLLFPCVPYAHPIQRSMVKRKDGTINYAFPEHALTPTQELPAYYHDAGQYYFFEIASFLSRGQLMSDHAEMIELNPAHVQDIDTPEDWSLAELKYKLLHT